MKQYIARYTKKLSNWRYKWLAIYALIAILFIVSYITIHSMIIDQSCYFTMTISNITLNLLLLFFMWGIISDRLFKRLPRKVGWLLWGAGTMLLILFFKFVGGYDTRWF